MKTGISRLLRNRHMYRKLVPMSATKRELLPLHVGSTEKGRTFGVSVAVENDFRRVKCRLSGPLDEHAGNAISVLAGRVEALCLPYRVNRLGSVRLDDILANCRCVLGEQKFTDVFSETVTGLVQIKVESIRISRWTEGDSGDETLCR